MRRINESESRGGKCAELNIWPQERWKKKERRKLSKGKPYSLGDIIGTVKLG
jgi:hypothetical protein